MACFPAGATKPFAAFRATNSKQQVKNGKEPGFSWESNALDPVIRTGLSGEGKGGNGVREFGPRAHRRAAGVFGCRAIQGKKMEPRAARHRNRVRMTAA
jgi:hypothetical protein